ncbi:MAG: type I-F CRISPR-associated protein Csy2 [Thiomicrospira sp.]
MSDVKNLLLIPYIKIHNANALSSNFTIGFPAMTAWLGGVHFLQRTLADTEFSDIKFTSVAVACHTIKLHTHKAENGFISSIIGTGNPLDKDGSRPSFIEEARCDLTVSLVIELKNWGLHDSDKFLDLVNHRIRGKMKLAGGDILSARAGRIYQVNSTESFAKLRNALMPSYCLIERRDLMINAMEQGDDALTALLDSQLSHRACEQDEQGNVTWHPPKRKYPGWIVPIATGYQGLTELGQAQHQRDANTPHRFAESVLTLGEFKMPIRFSHWDEMAWHYHSDTQNNLYLCQQNQPN